MSNCLMLHCGATQATRKEVELVYTPERTESYVPVAHRDLVDLIEDRMFKATGFRPTETSFGLQNEGKRLFGVFKFEQMRSAKAQLMIGFRNSLDKSMSAALASGLNVFVCDNLAVTGSAFRVMRRHTKNIWTDLPGLVESAVAAAAPSFVEMTQLQEALEDTPIDMMRGAEHIGAALFNGVLKPNQAKTSMEQWRTPHTEDFAPRNAWSLYNAFTEGLKRGPASNSISRYIGATGFFRDRVLPADSVPADSVPADSVPADSVPAPSRMAMVELD